jgi:hypothetical protein
MISAMTPDPAIHRSIPTGPLPIRIATSAATKPRIKTVLTDLVDLEFDLFVPLVLDRGRVLTGDPAVEDREDDQHDDPDHDRTRDEDQHRPRSPPEQLDAV